MKFKLITLYVTLFWLGLFVLGLWVFSALFRASPVPEFGTGLIGGVIYALVMRAIVATAVDSAKDFLTEWRNGLSREELKQIRAGLADVEAGRAKPIEQVRAELRERERIRRGEVCTDETHWHN